VVLSLAAFLLPAIVQAQVPVGRWEIVHLTGDSSAQTALYPGGFSTYLNGDGTGSTYGTFANSICVADDEGFNVVPTWTSAAGVYTITITVDNLGAAPNFSFVYTGTYNADTPIPGDETVLIPTITGTYYYTGDASACSTAAEGSPGTFIATFLPTVNSGFAQGALDSSDTGGGTPFDSPVMATITFSTPTSPGGISGVVTLGSNPTFNGGTPCFATTAGVVNPLTINATTSAQSGIIEEIYAQGFDQQGNPTTLVLDGYSANIYTTADNTDATANLITTGEWAAGAAIGEDNPAVTPTGVENDGTNAVMVLFYGVIGGACDSAGGADSPFHLLAGKPVRHGHRKVRPRGNDPKANRDHDRDHDHDFGRQN
jgi:hypothetical protein